jgi:hypothetical protein
VDDVLGSHPVPLVTWFAIPRGSSIFTFAVFFNAFDSIIKPTSGSVVRDAALAPANTTTCAPVELSFKNTMRTVLSLSNPVLDSAYDAVEPMTARL